MNNMNNLSKIENNSQQWINADWLAHLAVEEPDCFERFMAIVSEPIEVKELLAELPTDTTHLSFVNGSRNYNIQTAYQYDYNSFSKSALSYKFEKKFILEDIRKSYEKN